MEDEFVFAFEEDLAKDTDQDKPKYTSEIIEIDFEPILPPALPSQPSPALPQSNLANSPPLLPKKKANTADFAIPQKALSNKQNDFRLAQSLPVNIPSALLGKPDWEEDDEFIKPHELAAKTYNEQYLKVGLEWDFPSRPRTTATSLN